MAKEAAATDGINKIGEVLAEFGESRENVPDPTGLEDITEILTAAYQVYSAARISGFSDGQAFQFGRDYFTTMMQMAAAAQT